MAETSEENNKHGAVITKGGSVIALGVNRFRNHPDWIGDLPSGKRDGRCSFHAEVVAIRNAKRRRPKIDLRGAEIYVARVNRRGEERMSRPCDACHRAILKVGIKAIYYTLDE